MRTTTRGAERRAAIVRAVALRSPAPSWRELALIAGLRSSSTVGAHLHILVRAGVLVQHGSGRSRTLHVPLCDGHPWRPARIDGREAIVARFDVE